MDPKDIFNIPLSLILRKVKAANEFSESKEKMNQSSFIYG